jgi:hypothetical protein
MLQHPREARLRLWSREQLVWLQQVQEELQENAKRRSSVRFTEGDGLVDDLHRSANLGSKAAENAFLDIFEETKRNGSVHEDGGTIPLHRYNYDDDNESIDEGFIADDDSTVEQEKEDRKIMNGLLFSVGGAAVLFGLGFLARRLTGRNAEDPDAGGVQMYHGAEQAAPVAHASEGIHPDGSLDSSSHSMNASSSSSSILGNPGAATASGTAQ